MAHELDEEIVGEQFLDDQLHERARPRERPRTAAEQTQRTRTQLVPPVFGVELLFGSGGFFEVVVEIDHRTTDLAHGSSSTNHGARPFACRSCGGPVTARAVLGGCGQRGCARWARARISGPWRG